MTTNTEIEEIYEAEVQALDLAKASLMRYRPFAGLPETVAHRPLGVWENLLSHIRMSKREASGLLVNDLEQARLALRGQTASLLHIGQQRMAVLYHVTQLIGPERMMALASLWRALRAGDYETASECLLMSDWPKLVGDIEENKRLVLDLARTMRTGEFSVNRITP